MLLATKQGLFAAALVMLGAVACGSSTSSATVSAIALSPSPCLVGRTKSVQMSALATLSDGTKLDVGSRAETKWTTGSTETATVSAAGVVVGVNPGVTEITATYQGASGSVNCTVGP